MPYFCSLFTRGKSPDKESQEKLSSQERKTAFSHGVGKLFVNRMPVRGDVLRLHIHVSDDGICRENGNNNHNHREEFAHKHLTKNTDSNPRLALSYETKGSANFFAKCRADCGKTCQLARRFVPHKLEQSRSLTVCVQLVRLGLENEIDAFRFAARNSDILRLRSVRFVPCGNGVFTGREIGQCEGTIFLRRHGIV